MRNLTITAALGSLLLLMQGCLGVQNEQAASLTLRLFFEDDGAPESINGPDSIEVVLYDVTDGERVELETLRQQDFLSGDSILYLHLGPGLYEATVTGTDSQTGQTWASGCADLLLDRFDELYECDVLIGEP